MPRTCRPAVGEGCRHEETRTQPPHSSASTHLQPRHGPAAVKIVAAAPPGSARPGASARPGRSRRPRTRGGEKAPAASHRGGLCPGGSGLSEAEKKRLLHCVVVGGGPTGVEFSGELSDFIMRDVRDRYAHVKDYVKVTLIEANEILSSFDVGLRQYATNHLSKYGVKLVKGVVKEVLPTEIVLSDGTHVPYGLLVWSTGVGPSEFVKSLDLPKSPGGRIGIDEYLRVPSVEDVYALGDCAGFLESTKRPVLPALAQVAEREGKYLAQLFKKLAAQNGGGRAHCGKRAALGDPFVYKHIGSMASVGRYKALVDLRENKDARGVSMAGFLSWLMWRSAYLTRVVSWRNRFYVAVNWATTLVFGRDNTRIG